MDALTRIPLGTNLQAVDQSTTELTLCRKGKFEAYLGKLIRLLLVPLFQCLFPPLQECLPCPVNPAAMYCPLPWSVPRT